MGKIIKKFVKELKKITEIRNFALPEKAANWDNPRIFITKPLPLPNNMSTRYPPNFKSNRRRFTRLLQKGSGKDGYIAVNLDEFTCENKNNFFRRDGSISEDGFHYIWLALSEAVQLSDESHEKLIRKMKAKQLAALPATPEQPKQSEISMDGVSPLKTFEKRSPVRRSLNADFNATDKRNDNQQRNHKESAPAQHKRQHGKPKRGRNFYGPPPQGYFPFNSFYQGFQFGPFQQNHKGRRGHYRPY